MVDQYKNTTNMIRWVLAFCTQKACYHFAELSPGDVFQSQLPQLESFDSENALASRLGELTNDPNYYDKLINPEAYGLL